MKKNDLILGAAVMTAAVLMFLLMNLYGKIAGDAEGEDADRQVCIRVDGDVWGTWPLDEDQSIEVKLDSGYNRVRIASGEAYMEEADCPDGYCMHQGHISGGIDTIICLPHKLVVEIIEGDKSLPGNEIDTVAK